MKRSSPRKAAVLQALNAQSSPISLADLLLHLNASSEQPFAERSVRRWLRELAEEGLIEISGQKRSTRYLVIDRTDASLSPHEALDYIKQPIFTRDPVTYNWEWFEQYQPNETHYLPPRLRDELHQLGQRDGQLDDAGTYARKIYNRLLIDLSYHSSRLEGNTYSLLETEKLLAEGISAQGKLDAERIMILNHKEAIRHLVDNAPKLTIDFNQICTLHYLLADGLVPTGSAGNVRKEGVRIGGSTYMPLEDTTRLSQQLIAICKKATLINEPLEQSLFLLVHIAYLQAFIDVNKRTARLSANIPLIKHNRVPLSFNDVVKDDYAAAMICIYERLEVTPLAELFAFSYQRTCQQYDVTVEAMGIDEIRVRYRAVRRALIRDIVQQQKVGDALETTIKQFAEKTVAEADLHSFINSVKEDLAEIGPHRIAGMGITESELQDWMILRDRQ